MVKLKPPGPRRGPVVLGSTVITYDGDVFRLGTSPSPESPLGKALLGKFEKDRVSCDLPNGETRTFIIKRIE